MIKWLMSSPSHFHLQDLLLFGPNSKLLHFLLSLRGRVKDKNGTNPNHNQLQPQASTNDKIKELEESIQDNNQQQELSTDKMGIARVKSRR
jgi:hypothetical protein